MELHINNKLVKFPDSISLADALQQINVSTTQGIAIAVNDQVISRAELKAHILTQNDKVLIIQAAQGG